MLPHAGTMWAQTQWDTQTHVVLTTLKQKQKTPATLGGLRDTGLLFGKSINKRIEHS